MPTQNAHIASRKAALVRLSKDDLVALVINRDLNDFIARHDSFKDGETDPYGHGKRIPYIGWFWRDVDFAGGNIVVGHCGDFVGFMENNKWDYPERLLTAEEAELVLKAVTDAYEASRTGGNLAEIVKNTNAKVDAIWPLMQSLAMPRVGFWVYGPQGNVAHSDTAEGADEMIASLMAAAPGIAYRKVPV